MTAPTRPATLAPRFTSSRSLYRSLAVSLLVAAPLSVAACAEEGEPQTPVVTAPNATPLTRLPAGYAIDRTEVTRGQYQAWLATSPRSSRRVAACAWKEDFSPDARCLSAFDPYICQGEGCDEHPQVCVDWCDAQAYCEAAGKRLCGKIGGGTAGLAKKGEAAAGEWENACSAGGTTRFAVGDQLVAGACNTQSAGRGTTARVGEMAACRSPLEAYREIVDLSGNAFEWENACDSTADGAFCQVRGGSFNSDEALDACGVAHTYKRDFSSFYVGFRCCQD